MAITDPASSLRFQAASHDLSKAVLQFALAQSKIRWDSSRHEDMTAQVLIHLNESQRYLRRILLDIQAEHRGVDTVDPLSHN